LFQLPFYLPNVAQGVVAGFSVGFVIIAFTFFADRNVKPFRLIAEIFVALRMGAIEESKRFALFKKIMYVLGSFFILMGVFYGLVLIGVIKNGNPPPIPTIEEFIKMQQDAAKRGRF
jgi:hypothetical protein